MDVNSHNRAAWNREAAGGENEWSQPVDEETIARARDGDWSLILTPTWPVPEAWYGAGERGAGVAGKRVLCLASGGGQQAPVLAAAGAEVTSFDQSEEQLALDGQVAEREGLSIRLEQGDMADLSRFADASFDLIFHPVSNVFVADVLPVWRECRRVLVPGGRLLSGIMNPDYFLFDHHAIEAGAPMVISHSLPYADVTSLSPETLQKRIDAGAALEFSHSLDDQIGGQIAAGFAIAGFFEDFWDAEKVPVGAHMPVCFALLGIAV
ncbi:SAM-dependent methyltransferase [Aquisalinus flavus]|uniref:SAM-dependent methyltransferase n=2 Tax=Aquisalinus flavus TaxID=1526572 RepID=A0A8J2V3L2_9PROT|nr:SAM-dependent methyltransferase [Aquisalinus flavus]